MLDTIFKQTVAVLATAIIGAHVIWFSFAAVFVVKPQVDGTAAVTAFVLNVLDRSFDALEPSQRASLIAAIAEHGGGDVVVSLTAPTDRRYAARLLEQFFQDGLASRYRLSDRASVTTDADGRLWVRLDLDGEPIWISSRSAEAASPVGSLLLGALLATAAALVGGIALQRRVVRPLKALEDHVRRFESPATHSPLPETGIREIAAVSRALDRMAERLRLVEADRAVMLAGVSHDLRTPLTKLRLSLDLLHEADAELVDGAKRQVGRIEGMLVQFLEYARGFEAEDPAPIAVSTLLRRAVECTLPSDRVDIRLAGDPVVMVRQEALIRALGNLLTNAARYGGQPVEMSAHHADGNLVLAVRDSGPGMDTEAARALTRPFARGSAARVGEGTGLGLAIVEQVALAHGGTLRFARVPGGFEASLRLPVCRTSGPVSRPRDP
jgi:two-component system, OmpR family, osmolarity sensor histidine kinase EnvZ